MKRRILSIVLICVLVIGLAACSDAEKTQKNNPDGSEKVYKIGLVQLMEHIALDDARTGFIEKLDELRINYELDYQNAQGDIAVARTISDKFVSNGVDLIYAIATPAAEAASGATPDIPILFSAVTDPVSAHLVESIEKPGGNVTGTSDAADIKLQLSLYKKIDPNIKTIGIIYTLDEVNSLVQVEEVKKIAPEFDLEVETIGISNISDLPQSSESLIKKVDAMYIVSDNKIASSIALLSDLMIENNMISICAEESQVAGGVLLTNGMKYKDLGAQTAVMAKRILVDGESPANIAVEKSTNVSTVVNKNTLETLGLDPNLEVFKNAELIGE